MGIDSITKKIASTVTKAVETAKAEVAKVDIPKLAAPAKPLEGFDALKKKPVSVTGGFKAHKPIVSNREDLKEAVSGQRSVIQANAGSPPAPAGLSKAGESGHIHGADCGCGPTLKDGTLNTAATIGKGPGTRPTGSDFTAQAAKTPGIKKEDIDGAANKLARAALEKDFGVKVKDGDKKWTTEDLSRAHEAFSNMPAGDQAKLKDLDLVRDAKASAKSQAEMGEKGTVAGEYKPNTDTKDGKRVAPGQIALYDAAFPAGTDEAARKASIHVITHEAGHAVEGRARDEAMTEWSKANDAQTAATVPLNAASKANNEAWGVGKNPPADSTNGAAAAFGGASGKDKPGMAFVGAQNAVTGALDKLQKAKTPEEITKAQEGLDKAKATRDTALKGMSGHPKSSKADAWVAATDKQEKTAKTYAEANAKYIPTKDATDAKLTDLKKVATVTSKTEDGVTTISAKTSTELAGFEKAKGKEKSVSGYGASKGAEGYAEAYALYQRDPALMKQDFPNQYKYFHAKHQNVND